MDGQVTIPEPGQCVRAADFGNYVGDVTAVLVRDGVKDMNELARVPSMMADVGCQNVVRVQVTEPGESRWQVGQLVDVDVRTADLVRVERPASRAKR
jgi:hypothetical protein